MEHNALLPLGSIVEIHDDTQAMIIGYYPVSDSNTSCYTYLGLRYPVGIVDYEALLRFDKAEIKQIVQEGYSEPESLKHRNMIQILVESDVLSLIKDNVEESNDAKKY